MNLLSPLIEHHMCLMCQKQDQVGKSEITVIASFQALSDFSLSGCMALGRDGQKVFTRSLMICVIASFLPSFLAYLPLFFPLSPYCLLLYFLSLS